MRFENTAVYNIDGALRGMRNPLSSWNKSDSEWRDGVFIIGKNDLELAKRLIAGGTEHRKFLRQVFISVDITAPIYWWSEFDTYKVGTTANSTSTMHTLAKKPITSDMFERDNPCVEGDEEYWQSVCAQLEQIRQKYNETGDYAYFRALKQRLPTAFLQKRTVSLNYEVVLNMLRQRTHHRLREWSKDFVAWTKTLPYQELLTLPEKEKGE